MGNTLEDRMMPPLRQSIFDQMGCEEGYKLVHIQGLKSPNTTASERGVDIHTALAEYAAHCAAKRIKSDYAYMDKLRASVGEEAAQILETCRDSITIDWQNFFAAEVSLGLSESFKPSTSFDHEGNELSFRNDLFGNIMPLDYEPPAYCGIVDVIYLYNGGRAAKIADYKSHPRPFDADTFQGKLYSLMLMMHLPELEEVEFGLQFVRYAHQFKTYKYFRSDVPQMMDAVRRGRARQIQIHQKATIGGPLRTHGGAQCVYCPATLNPAELCPLFPSGMNHMLNMTPEDRLGMRLSMDAFQRANNQAMKDYVDGTGQTISSKDANGKRYTYGPTLTTSTTYPLFLWNPNAGFELNPVVEKLLDWITYTMPEDGQATKKGLPPWPARLRIGSTEFTTPLKAGKRADLHQWMQDTPGVIVKTDEVEMKLQRDAEVDDGTGSEYETYRRNGGE